ncbi:hypothetical protein AKJ18_20995 [Vibrio xuii]|nr:hypothetical protein AKJ18_20995 [Vibrio xuii]
MQHLCKGATLMCTGGTSPSQLDVSPSRAISIDNKPVANVADHIPMVNIKPFGNCTLMAPISPPPCMPATPSPWNSPNSTIKIDHQMALTFGCSLQCSIGGTIQCFDPGQVNVVGGNITPVSADHGDLVGSSYSNGNDDSKNSESKHSSHSQAQHYFAPTGSLMPAKQAIEEEVVPIDTPIEKVDLIKTAKKDEQILKEISDKFVTQSHMQAIKECADLFDMVITFRESGEFTIDALNRGASAKGHDILEKTLKPKTIQRVYNLTYEYQQLLEAEGLMGIVGHVVDHAGGKTLGGVYSTIYEADSSGCLKAKIFPLDTSSIEMLSFSIAAMKSELGNNWITKLFTGDYDTHEILVGDGNGKYNIVEPESKNEREVIENINLYVSAVDPSREYTPYNPNSDYENQARHVVRHGAQVNYGWHQMIAEPNAKVIKQVAEPGEFPLAYYSAKERGWGMVKDFKGLKDLYVDHEATMPFYWTNSVLDLDTNVIEWQSFKQDDNSQDPNHITINKKDFKTKDQLDNCKQGRKN